MLTTLYGTGSVMVTRDKDVFQSKDGVIQLPEDLAQQLINTGTWSRTKPADPAPDEKTGVAKAGDLKKAEGDDSTGA